MTSLLPTGANSLPKTILSSSMQTGIGDNIVQINVICCSSGASASNRFDDRRIYYNEDKDELDTEEGTSKIGACFKKLCCCGGSPPKPLSVENKNKACLYVAAYLYKEYGESIAEASTLLSEVDLVDSYESNKTIYKRDFKKLIESAEELKNKKDQIEKAIKILKFKQDSVDCIEEIELNQSDEKIEISELSELIPKEKIKENIKKVKVVHAEGLEECFNPKKLKNDIKELPFSTEIDEKTIKQITTGIKQWICNQQKNEVTTNELRRNILQEAQKRKFSLELPEKLKDIPIENIKKIGGRIFFEIYNKL